MSSGSVFAIYVAPAAKAAMVAVPQARVVVERGLEGDRYHEGVGAFSRWPGSGRAVTLIEAEAVEAVAREHGIDLGDGRHRRNLVTTGIRLADLVDRRFRIGGAMLRGARLCAPCQYLERLLGPGTFEAMKGRGGLRADVLEGGDIRTGDAIILEPTRGAPPAATPASDVLS
jgi:MOSC domain-containing protein YiiM